MVSTQALKNAARAIEHDLWTDPSTQANYLVKDGAILRRWEPLEDDGDAFRLASRLRIGIGDRETTVTAFYRQNMSTGSAYAEEHDMSDKDRATRHAIVRVAAIIGAAL